ncbi:hypothetical protein EV363DRAFT_1450407 [Boletus edulis]|nr:hypothetical protein EV363DRAFT_1450407 [Boletus edulis]
MPGGRPKKKQRNIIGLWNQRRSTISPLVPLTSNTGHSEPHDSGTPENETDLELLSVQFDGLKISYADEYEEEVRDGDSELDIDDEIELEMLNDVEFGRRLAKMVMKEDEKDADWVPHVLRRVDHKLRLTTYKKGPDVMSKSKCTQQRYQRASRNQSSLDVFGFSHSQSALKPWAQDHGVNADQPIRSDMRESVPPALLAAANFATRVDPNPLGPIP